MDTPTGICYDQGEMSIRSLLSKTSDSAKRISTKGVQTMIIRKVSQAALNIVRFIEAFFQVEPLYRSH
jgi:hypothetical protein